MRLRVCYKADKETLWEFMSAVEDQVKKRKWKMVEPMIFPGTLTNVIQLLLPLPEGVIYGCRYQFRWYAIVKGKAKESEISEGLVALRREDSWTIQRV